MNFLVSAYLGDYESGVARRLVQMQRDDIIRRMWERDHTVWKREPDEITNRLGWLTAPQVMQRELPAIWQLVADVRHDGYEHVRVLGMGGASLAAEVFEQAFGVSPGYLDCAVIDSTHPDAVLAARHAIDLTKTLFIVSIKKYALETVSLFKYFYNAVADAVGPQQAGAHFVAITDPGVWVNDLAADYEFRSVCLNDPDVGGRYSPLTYVGLLPAALLGVNVEQFLAHAQSVQARYRPESPPDAHPGAWFGAVLGELALQGRDKLTIVTSGKLTGFADWAEQLLAESTGKERTGILPIVHEELLSPTDYGPDRVFVMLELDGAAVDEPWLKSLGEAGHPVLRFRLASPVELAEQFYLWCFATAVAGYCLGINPFDQPNVEATKAQTRQLLERAAGSEKLAEQSPTVSGDGIDAYAETSAASVSELLQGHLNNLKPGDYIALHVYAPYTQGLDEALQDLRRVLVKRTRCAVTIGYGPRFLHSTGQLHKGDKGNGLFIQFIGRTEHDAGIPDQAGEDRSSCSFNTLIMAQALGDAQALKAANRRLIRFHFDINFGDGIRRVIEAIPGTIG